MNPCTVGLVLSTKVALGRGQISRLLNEWFWMNDYWEQWTHPKIWVNLVHGLYFKNKSVSQNQYCRNAEILRPTLGSHPNQFVNIVNMGGCALTPGLWTTQNTCTFNGEYGHFHLKWHTVYERLPFHSYLASRNKNLYVVSGNCRKENLTHVFLFREPEWPPGQGTFFIRTKVEMKLKFCWLH